MTREEAIAYGKRAIDLGLNDEPQAFCELAIKALEQEPCEDTISRQAAIDALDKRFDSVPMEQTTEILLLRKDLKELPSVQPEKRTEERTETHACDCISRQAAIYIASEYCHPANIADELSKLPSVQPEQQWIPVSERLPESFQRVLVTVARYNGDKVVRVAEYYNRNRVFRIKENDEQWEVGEKGLLAWMPLPEPLRQKAR